MKDFSELTYLNPLAVKIGATTVNVTKIQEIDDPVQSTPHSPISFRVVLVSGVTAFGTLDQYEEAMTKFLDYLDFTHRKLCNELSQLDTCLEPIGELQL